MGFVDGPALCLPVPYDVVPLDGEMACLGGLFQTVPPGGACDRVRPHFDVIIVDEMGFGWLGGILGGDPCGVFRQLRELRRSVAALVEQIQIFPRAIFSVVVLAVTRFVIGAVDLNLLDLLMRELPRGPIWIGVFAHKAGT